MTPEENRFNEIGQTLNGAVQGKLFGKPCFKIYNKAFTCFFQNAMVFKLSGDSHSEALSLEGSKLFDPSGKGRPMKEWVQVPGSHSERWKTMALSALEYVRANS